MANFQGENAPKIGDITLYSQMFVRDNSTYYFLTSAQGQKTLLNIVLDI